MSMVKKKKTTCFLVKERGTDDNNVISGPVGNHLESEKQSFYQEKDELSEFGVVSI